MPLLEDSILNGRLRELEVIVKEAFLRGLKQCEGGLKGVLRGFVGLETLRDWVALRKVMLDPYLERSVLRSGILNLDALGMIQGNDLVEEAAKLNDVTWLLQELGGEQSKAYGDRMRT